MCIRDRPLTPVRKGSVFHGVKPSPTFTLSVSVSTAGSPAAKTGFLSDQFAEVSRRSLKVAFMSGSPSVQDKIFIRNARNNRRNPRVVLTDDVHSPLMLANLVVQRLDEILSVRRIEKKSNPEVHVGSDHVVSDVAAREVVPRGRFVLDHEPIFWANTQLVQRRENAVDVQRDVRVKDRVILIQTQILLDAGQDTLDHVGPPF